MQGIVCSNDLILSEVNRIQQKSYVDPKEFDNMREWIEITRASCLSLGEMIENMLTFCKVK
jgi:hypothetical protein